MVFCLLVKGVYTPWPLVVRPLKKHFFYVCLPLLVLSTFTIIYECWLQIIKSYQTYSLLSQISSFFHIIKGGIFPLLTKWRGFWKRHVIIQPFSYKRYFRCNNCFLLLVYTIYQDIQRPLLREEGDGAPASSGTQ